MTTSTSSFLSDADGTRVVTYTWSDVDDQPAGVVQIAHGLAEHGERYDRFAHALNTAGFVVHAVDHRGHGRTANGRLGDFGAAGFGGLIADVAQFGAALRARHGGPARPRRPLGGRGAVRLDRAGRLRRLVRRQLRPGRPCRGAGGA